MIPFIIPSSPASTSTFPPFFLTPQSTTFLRSLPPHPLLPISITSLSSTSSSSPTYSLLLSLFHRLSDLYPSSSHSFPYHHGEGRRNSHRHNNGKGDISMGKGQRERKDGGEEEEEKDEGLYLLPAWVNINNVNIIFIHHHQPHHIRSPLSSSSSLSPYLFTLTLLLSSLSLFSLSGPLDSAKYSSLLSFLSLSHHSISQYRKLDMGKMKKRIGNDGESDLNNNNIFHLSSIFPSILFLLSDIPPSSSSSLFTPPSSATSSTSSILSSPPPFTPKQYLFYHMTQCTRIHSQFGVGDEILSLFPSSSVVQIPTISTANMKSKTSHNNNINNKDYDNVVDDIINNFLLSSSFTSPLSPLHITLSSPSDYILFISSLLSPPSPSSSHHHSLFPSLFPSLSALIENKIKMVINSFKGRWEEGIREEERQGEEELEEEGTMGNMKNEEQVENMIETIRKQGEDDVYKQLKWKISIFPHHQHDLSSPSPSPSPPTYISSLTSSLSHYHRISSLSLLHLYQIKYKKYNSNLFNHIIYNIIQWKEREEEWREMMRIRIREIENDILRYGVEGTEEDEEEDNRGRMSDRMSNSYTSLLDNKLQKYQHKYHHLLSTLLDSYHVDIHRRVIVLQNEYYEKAKGKDKNIHYNVLWNEVMKGFICPTSNTSLHSSSPSSLHSSSSSSSQLSPLSSLGMLGVLSTSLISSLLSSILLSKDLNEERERRRRSEIVEEEVKKALTKGGSGNKGINHNNVHIQNGNRFSNGKGKENRMSAIGSDNMNNNININISSNRSSRTGSLSSGYISVDDDAIAHHRLSSSSILVPSHRHSDIPLVLSKPYERFSTSSVSLSSLSLLETKERGKKFKEISSQRHSTPLLSSFPVEYRASFPSSSLSSSSRPSATPSRLSLSSSSASLVHLENDRDNDHNDHEIIDDFSMEDPPSPSQSSSHRHSKHKDNDHGDDQNEVEDDNDEIKYESKYNNQNGEGENSIDTYDPDHEDNDHEDSWQKEGRGGEKIRISKGKERGSGSGRKRNHLDNDVDGDNDKDRDLDDPDDGVLIGLNDKWTEEDDDREEESRRLRLSKKKTKRDRAISSLLPTPPVSDLPPSLHSLTIGQLKSLLTSYNVTFPIKSQPKATYVEMIKENIKGAREKYGD